MKLRSIVLGVVGWALMGCGLTPAVTVDNPFGMDSKQVAVALSATGELVTGRAETAGVPGSGTVEATFGDIASLPATPTGFNLNLPLDARVTVDGEVQPDTVVLSAVSLDLALSDASHATPVQLSVPLDGSITLTRQTDGSYAAASTVNPDPKALAFLATLEANVLPAVMDILTTGGENAAQVTVHFTADSLSPGETVNVTFQGTTGKVSF